MAKVVMVVVTMMMMMTTINQCVYYLFIYLLSRLCLQNENEFWWYGEEASH
jgi:hypothetical protein